MISPQNINIHFKLNLISLIGIDFQINKLSYFQYKNRKQKRVFAKKQSESVIATRLFRNNLLSGASFLTLMESFKL